MPSSLKPPGQLRALLERGIVVMPGAFNAISAQLIEATGFKAVYISGAGVTNSMTGYPDIALLTLTEMAQQCKFISHSVRLPCVADADTGYGETHNVMRAVEEMEHSGLAGIHLEDQVAPKRCGHLDGKQVVSPKDMARKIAAAVKARRDPDFLLIARTDARGVEGFDAAVDRAQLYLDAGADAIFPEALETAEEFGAFAKSVQAPLLANMTEFGKSPLLTVPELDALGYRMAIFPMTQLRVMMRAAEDALRTIRDDGTQQGLLEMMQTRAELYDLIDYPRYREVDAEIASLYPDDSSA